MKFMEGISRIFDPLIEATVRRLIMQQEAAEMQANVWWMTVGEDIVEARIVTLELSSEAAEILRHQSHAHVINYAVHRLTRDARMSHLVTMRFVSTLTRERYSATTVMLQYKEHMRWHEERLEELGFDIRMLNEAFP